uniref:pilus assembly FimT family protein n=1 Tax=Candidatus Electrothrix sp. TaxID=2170559 RepID=UPI0040579299
MQESGGKRKEVGGFSFVELMVVIALIGILSAISIPSFLSGLPEKRLKAAVRNVYADLHKARSLAVKKNKKITVRFDEAGSYYYFDEDESGTAGNNEWNADEEGGNLADYGEVIFGQGKATKNWNKKLIKNVASYKGIYFKAVGTADNDSVYLQYPGDDVCYAITTTRYGKIQIRRFDGVSWDTD